MRRRLTVPVALSLLAGVPVVAIAAAGTNGQSNLTTKAAIKPAQASTKAKPRAVAFDYSQTLAAKDGSRITDHVRYVTITMPVGMRFDINAVPQCKESTLEDKTQGTSACPAGSIVGAGSGTADARPAVAALIPSKVTAYNGVLDTDVNGNPQAAVPALLLVAEANGVQAKFPFEIRGHTLFLDDGPPAADGSADAFIARDLVLHLKRLVGSKHTPYIRAPTACPKGGWKFTTKFTFSSGQSPVTSTVKVPCKA